MTSSQLPDKHYRTKQFIKAELKRLKVKDVDWDHASDPTPSLEYNCFGLAVGLQKWWEPPDIRGGVLMNPVCHWPENAPINWSIEAYIEAAKSMGFEVCTKAEWDSSAARKIVLFHKDGEFRHAALCLSTDRWKSKLGEYSDIEHAPDAMDCGIYGDGRVYMRMNSSASPTTAANQPSNAS